MHDACCSVLPMDEEGTLQGGPHQWCYCNCLFVRSIYLTPGLWNTSSLFMVGLRAHFLYSDCYVDGGDGPRKVAVSENSASQSKIWEFCSNEDLTKEMYNEGIVFNAYAKPLVEFYP
eukprot:TRINITY_DN1055_c0_g1_i1.p1 TRINITY_DN1055_c0_g1~~TRINITY_DN1055_c0_g1_i1.p1  ORF type:complete len:117 (+),score=11.69 TRINITY_DN1055_c0_g1_i1:511-861(+)